MKKFMVIETFIVGKRDQVYKRFHDKGRMLPAGLYYLDSWLAKDGRRCFQLMETEEPDLFQTWFAAWSDLVRFEIIELGEKPTRMNT